jgi:hypothetical protein
MTAPESEQVTVQNPPVAKSPPYIGATSIQAVLRSNGSSSAP